MTPDDFDATYQLRMIMAYPVIAQMDADQLMLADAADKRQAFERILANRNLARTHQIYLDENPTQQGESSR